MKYCGVVTDRSWFEAIGPMERGSDELDTAIKHELSRREPHRRIYSDEVPMAEWDVVRVGRDCFSCEPGAINDGRLVYRKEKNGFRLWV